MKHKTLTTQSEIEAYLHRTRMAILSALGDGEATASQIAAALGVHPANLTRHIRLLLDAGLIELSKTRDAGRNLEKYYRAEAQSFDVAPEADQLTGKEKIALSLARSELSRAIAQLPGDNERPVQVHVTAARLPQSAQKAFIAELSALVERFQNCADPQGEPMALVLSLHPTTELPKGAKVKLNKSGGRKT
tara:strand:+ start:1781 stop:2353 length:573 start_codon:yes stop_codon:yes gene_type:complete